MNDTFRTGRIGRWAGALLLAATAGGEAGADQLYWSAFNSEWAPTFWRANLDGSALEPVRIDSDVRGMTVDPSGGHIYWVATGIDHRGWLESVYRARLDGSEATVVLELVESERVSMSDVRVDPEHAQLYYSGTGIWRVDLAGGNVEQVLEEPAQEFALDFENRMLYATYNRDVYRVELAGGEPAPLFFAPVWGEIGMALDLAGGKIYWAGTRQDLVVGRANLDGSELEELIVIDATLDDTPGTLALDLENTKMYFAAGGPIYRANLDGSVLETFYVGDRTSDLALLRERAGPFLRGDCNGDGALDISDASCVLNRLFRGAPAPTCTATMNANGDADADIADATYLLNHLFLGGPAPPAPFPDCAPSALAADEALGCAEAAAHCG